MSEIVVPNTLRDRLEELAGRRREVWLVAGLVVLAVMVALMIKGRSEPRIAPPSESPAGATVAAPGSVPDVPGGPTTDSVTSTDPASGSMLVHIAGAVRRPGLYELPMGARVADAIDLARGPKPNADLDALNLAEPMTDGQKIDVPRRGEGVEFAGPTTSTPGVVPSPGADPAGVIDLNTADQIALESIPGIGPVTAQSIIAYRTEVGRFDSIDQLLEVSGIGPATLESMRPYVTV